MSNEVIGGLTYLLGAEWDENGLDSIEEGLDRVSAGFLAILGTFSAVVAGGSAFVQQFASINDELGKMSANRKVTIGFLQSLEEHFGHVGLEASQASSALDKTQKMMQDYNEGKADYYSLSKIGINPNDYKDNESFFLAVIDGLKNIESETERINLAENLLGSRDLENLLEGGSDAILKQKKELEELGVLISNQDYKASADFNDILQDTFAIIKGISNKLAVSFMPSFTELMKNFKEFMKVNSKIISQNLKAFFDGVSASVAFFSSLILRTIEHLGGLQNVVLGLALVFAVWQLPLILTVGAIVAVLVAFDDLMNFIKGNDSVIGDFVDAGLEKFQEFKDAFPVLGAVVQASLDTLVNLFVYFKDYMFKLWDLITGKISFSDFLSGQLQAVTDLLSKIKDSFLSVFDAIFLSIKEKLANIPFLENIMSMFGDTTVNVNNTGTQIIPNAPQASMQQITNHYAISASVDATNKSTGQALKEIRTASYNR